MNLRPYKLAQRKQNRNENLKNRVKKQQKIRWRFKKLSYILLLNWLDLKLLFKN